MPNKFDENHLISFYSKNINDFSSNGIYIFINNNLTSKNVYIKINPDIEGFQFPQMYFIYLENNFFVNYYNKNICHKEQISSYKVTICNKNFNNNMIRLFPKIEFQIANITFEFTYEDLFYKYYNIYCFKILEQLDDNKFHLGRILLKKYIITFNSESRQIIFYNKEDNKENDGNPIDIKYIIIIIVLSVFLIILFVLVFYFGNQIYQKRKKKAFELNDEYDYTPTKEEGIEPLFKQ